MMVRQALARLRSSARPSARRSCRASAARRSASRYTTTTCATKVFVAATLISRPGAGEEHAVGVAGGLRAHHVGDRQRPWRRARARDAVRPACPPSRPTARSPMTRSPGPTTGIAVAVLGGDVRLDRDARPALDRVARRSGRRGSAVPQATIDDPLRPRRRSSSSIAPRSPRSDAVARAHGAIDDRLGEHVGLLVDLLEHEGLVAVLLGHRPRPSRPASPARSTGGRRPAELDAVVAHDDDLAVLDQLDASRVWARNAGMAEAPRTLAVTAADHQRALLARGARCMPGSWSR